MTGRPLLQAAKSQVWEIEDSQGPAGPESVEEQHPKRYLNPYELKALAEDKKREKEQAKERQNELMKSNLIAAKSAGSGSDKITEGKKVVKLIVDAPAAGTSAGSSNQAVETAVATSVIPSQETRTPSPTTSRQTKLRWTPSLRTARS